MQQKEIIIKIQNDRILFNPEFSIDISQTNIPFEHLRFKTNEDIYWKVEILEYKLLEKCLNLKIIDYQATNLKDFKRQKTTKKIDKVMFESFDWPKLYPLLSSFTKGKFVNQLINPDEVFGQPKERPSIQSGKSQLQTSQEVFQPVVRKIIEEFRINFNDAQFKLGYVTFKKCIKEIDKSFEFKITNDHILPEFDNIKYWFSKKLKTKKFHVKASITLIDSKVNEINATSKEIELITPELIDSIKYLRTIELTKVSRVNNLDKSLFTAEDIFAQIDTEDVEGNVFKQSEQDILEFLIEKRSVRNKKELAYLSGKKQSENHPIRYTLHPNFGFLFLIEGVENNHFVWELLNSHATYIWTIDKSEKDIKLQFKRIESIVNTIRAIGRVKYKMAYKHTHQDNDLAFRVIKHKDISSDLLDEFPKWKNKLNEQLT